MSDVHRTFEEHKLYKIRFYDHSVGSHDKMICEVVGWIIKDEPEHVVLTNWLVDTDDKDIKRDNVEPVSILKAVMIRTRKYS